jgi:hypothetical protein
MSKRPSIKKRGKILLCFPVQMRTQFQSYKSTLVVGPFDTVKAGREWEAQMAAAVIQQPDTTPEHVEARTVFGQGIKTITGHNKAEISIAPSGKDPMVPDKHYIIDEAEVQTYGIVLPIHTINPAEISGTIVGHNITRYINRLWQFVA